MSDANSPSTNLLDADDDEDIFGPPTAAPMSEQISVDPLQSSTPILQQSTNEDDLFASAMETPDEINLNDDFDDIVSNGMQEKPKLELFDANDDDTPEIEHEITTPTKEPDTPPLLSGSLDNIGPKEDAMTTLDLYGEEEDVHDYKPTIKASIQHCDPTTPHSSKKPPRNNDDDVVADPVYDMTINITGYEKRGEGMNAFTAFNVTVKAFSVPGFGKQEYLVPRRFSDFLGLYEKLAEKYTHTGRIVPMPPGKSLYGMTKTKMAKNDEDSGASEFLEKRRASLERFVRRVVLHPVLVQDPDVRDFLTLETELPKATNTSALSGAGFKRMFKGFGDAVNKIAYHMDETDSWFEEKQMEIEDLDDAMKKLHASFESLSLLRRELSTSTDSFCKGMQLLAACEENTALSRAFSQLAETEEKVAHCQAEQADKDFYVMAETLKDYVALIASVKEIFYERVKVWNKWQDSQKMLTAKREAKTRFELQGKTDKLPNAKREVSEVEEKVAEGEEEFEKISRMIRKEMVRFDKQRVVDLKNSLVEYLHSLAHTQTQLIKHWETFLPEAKQIIL